jgi:hypothetical protein
MSERDRSDQIASGAGQQPGSAARRSRSGRRAVMLGAAAAGAGAVASLAGGGQAQAKSLTNGSPVELGEINNASATTRVITSSGTGLAGQTSSAGQSGVTGIDTGTTGTGHGTYGRSASGTGAYGTSTSGFGVSGNSRTSYGVYGSSGLGAASSSCGVVGQLGGDGIITGFSNAGVLGADETTAGQTGVAGISNNGIAMLAVSRGSGAALRANGSLEFSSSGVATVKKGSKTVTVKTACTSTSIVLATIQKPQTGVYIEAAAPGKDSFKVTLSKAVLADLPVGWFVMARFVPK